MLQGVQERNRQDTCKQVKVNNVNLDRERYIEKNSNYYRITGQQQAEQTEKVSFERMTFEINNCGYYVA